MGFKNTRVLKASPKTQEAILEAVRVWQERNDRWFNFNTKLEAIDRAYYTYKSDVENSATGVTRRRSRSKAGDPSAVLDNLDFEIPALVSQIDTVKAYLTDVFLSGSPMFPVVSTPENAQAAEQVEALVQNHVERGRWKRHYLRFFLDCAKYNVGGIELEWAGMFDLSVSDKIQQSALRPFVDRVGGVQRSLQYLNQVRSIDIYNMVWDRRVAPAEVGVKGEYIGYNELVNYPDLVQRMRILEAENRLFNGDEALSKRWVQAAKPTYWRDRPKVSRYITTQKSSDWFAWTNDDVGGFHVTTMYLRIVPEDYFMDVPEADLPQIWKVTLVNMEVIIQLDPVITAFDFFPIYIGGFVEDGFDYQTKAMGESLQVIQDLASDIMRTLLSDSRRSIADRLIYDPTLISKDSIANLDPAARIPMKNNSSFLGKGPQDAVWPIPYENRNVSNLMSNLETVLSLGEWATGQNQFRQGQTRPGNRTLGEFSETMGNSELRSQLIAWTLEDMVIAPFKEQLKFNVLRFAEDDQILSKKLERVVRIDPAVIRSAIVEFKVADGLIPKNKLANTDAYVAFLNLFGTVPQLAQVFDMGGLVTYLASLLGAAHIDRFQIDPAQRAAPAPGAEGQGENATPRGAGGGGEVPPGVPPVRAVPAAGAGAGGGGGGA